MLQPRNSSFLLLCYAMFQLMSGVTWTVWDSWFYWRIKFFIIFDFLHNYILHFVCGTDCFLSVFCNFINSYKTNNFISKMFMIPFKIHCDVNSNDYVKWYSFFRCASKEKKAGLICIKPLKLIYPIVILIYRGKFREKLSVRIKSYACPLKGKTSIYLIINLRVNGALKS